MNEKKRYFVAFVASLALLAALSTGCSKKEADASSATSAVAVEKPGSEMPPEDRARLERAREEMKTRMPAEAKIMEQNAKRGAGGK